MTQPRWIEYLRRQLEQTSQEVFRLEEALKKASEDTGLEGVVFDPKTEASDSANSKQLSNILIRPNSGLSDRAYIGLSNLSMDTALDIHHNRSALETRLWARGVSLTTLKEVREWALTKGIQLEPCEAALEPEPLLCVEEMARLSKVLVGDSGLGVRARKALYKQGISSALDA